QRVRAEQHVDAECASLPHDSVKQNVGRLCNTIIFDEELLELVDDQQAAGNRFGAARFFEAGHVLDSESPEQVAPTLQFLIKPLQYAEAKFTVALDGHHSRVRQAVRGVTLEFNAFLKIHEVELHLFRAAPKRQ